MHRLLAFIKGKLGSKCATQCRVMYCGKWITMQGTLADCQKYVATYGNDRSRYTIRVS